MKRTVWAFFITPTNKGFCCDSAPAHTPLISPTEQVPPLLSLIDTPLETRNTITLSLEPLGKEGYFVGSH